MENITKILISLVIFIITSAFAYLFRMRQLYVVVSKLYRHSSISKDGSLCEIIIYNKGNQVEEDIQVELAPELKCELLASSYSDILLNDSTIKINRIHKGNEVSAILLVENGTIGFTNIKLVSSKGTNGKVCKKETSVPRNYAKTFIMCVLFVVFALIQLNAYDGYNQLRNAFAKYQLSFVVNQGWDGLGGYYSSAIKQSYSNQEFPVQYVGSGLEAGGYIELYYKVCNKMATPLYVHAEIKGGSKTLINGVPTSPHKSFVTVPPMSKQEFMLLALSPPKDSPRRINNIDFTFGAGDEYIFDIKSDVDVNIKHQGDNLTKDLNEEKMK